MSTIEPITSHHWSCQWIWLDEVEPKPNRYALFRTEITLHHASKLRVTAASRYRLYLDGQWLIDGPPHGQPDYWFFDEHDLPSRPSGSTACLAVVVHDVGGPEGHRPGFLAEVVDETGKLITATGRGWRCLPGDAWSDKGHEWWMNHLDPFQEIHDARLMPSGWMQPGFNDSCWRTPVVMRRRIPGGSADTEPHAAGPWHRLVKSPIPPRRHTPLPPVSVTRVEENIALENRGRPNDLSIVLSMPGQPTRWTAVRESDNLLSEAGVTTLCCSTGHLRDRDFDGYYEPTVLLDFGRPIAAYVELDIEAPAGARITIGLAERLIDGYFHNALEAQYCFSYTAVEGRQTWQSFVWRSFRHLKLRLHHCFEPVRIHAVRARTYEYPFENRGDFTGTDDRLTRTFEMCRNTIQLCCGDSMVDTPWREQAQWVGDVSAVTIGGVHACFGDVLLPAKFLRQAEANPLPSGILQMITTGSVDRERNIPDYSLWWTLALWDHYLFTGDRPLLEAMYPAALRVIGAFARHTNAQGLIQDMPGWVFVDWAFIDRRGQCAALNALFYGAMGTVRSMAEQVGDPASIERLDHARRQLHGNFASRFTDPDTGLIHDAWRDGYISKRVSEHGNYAAILWGLVSDAQIEHIIQKTLLDHSLKLIEASPFYTTVMLHALARLGRHDLAIQLIRDRWGRRMVGRGMSTCFEEWGENGSWREGTYRGFMRSHSHAWSAGPAQYFIHRLIGLEILEPGCGHVLLAPAVLDIDYRVVCPTPLGPITVCQEAGQIDIDAPRAMRVTRS